MREKLSRKIEKPSAAERFVVPRPFLIEPCEKWLREHHGELVTGKNLDLFVGVLHPSDRTITWAAWVYRVEQVYGDYRADGWHADDDPKNEFLLWKMIEGVGVGIGFNAVAAGVRELRDHDPPFRAAVSDSGYRNFIHLGGIPKAPTATKVIRSHIRKCTHAKKGKKGAKLAGADGGSGGIGRKPEPGGQESEKKPPPSTALVPAERTDALTADERRQLATLEKTIARNAAAVFEFGAALKAIRDGRLYRASHGSFEAYCAGRWGISKSDGHRQIAAAVKYEAAAPVAKKLGLELSCESQMRPLANVADEDLPHVLKRAKRLLSFDVGTKTPGRLTAEVLSRAVREETTPPDELGRKRSREPAVRSRKGVARAELDAKTAGANPSLAQANTLAAIATAEVWRDILSGDDAGEDAGNPDRWHGQPYAKARVLHAINSIVRRAWDAHAEDRQFLARLRGMLRGVAIAIELGQEPLGKIVRRAK